MSAITVTIDQTAPAISPVTPEQIAAVVAVVEQVVNYADLAAKFTGTKVDDSVVNFLKTGIATVKPYTEQAWFVSFVNFALSFVTKPSVVAALTALKNAASGK